MGNLIYYDLKNTLKKILGYVLGLFVFAGVVRFLWSDWFGMQFFTGYNNFYIGDIIRYVSIGVLLCLATLMLMIMIVRQTQWFDENLLSPQGQFTNMLPVPTWKLVLSKVISSFVCSLFMLFVLLLVAAVFFFNTGKLSDVMAIINDLGRDAAQPFTAVKFLISMSIFSVISMCAIVTECFLALIVGQLFSRMRNAMIFFSFIVISALVLMGEYMVLGMLGMNSIVNLKHTSDIMHFCQSISLGVSVMDFIMIFVYWGIASKLLKSNLNLL